MEGDYSAEIYGNESGAWYNASDCAYAEWEPSYVLIPSIYLLVFALGLSGNGLVIWTSYCSRNTRKTADTFIAHLALADLAFVLTLPLWAAYAALGYHWPFGTFLCKASSYLVLLTMYCSIFLLVCLSLDRYSIIVRSSASSSRLRAGPRSRGVWLACVWLLSGVLALPAAVFRRALEVWEGAGEVQVVCGMDLSSLGVDGDLQQVWLAGLGLSSTLLGFTLPFLAMVTCYWRIGRTVSRHFHQREKKHRRRLLTIILGLVLAFATCWLPFHLFKTLVGLENLELLPLPCRFSALLYVVHPYTTCLAYINSCLNPFLYAFFDRPFRDRCARVLSCRRCPKRPGASPRNGSPSVSNATRCEGTSLKV